MRTHEDRLSYYKEYNARPDVRERKKIYLREYQRKYSQRPEVRKKRRAYEKEYRARPEVREMIKKRAKEYQNRHDVREKRNIRRRSSTERAKINRYLRLYRLNHPARARRLKKWKKYNLLTIEAVLSVQWCEVGCGRPAKVIDHCHERGHIRGHLCNNCNLALGLLKDSPVVIQKLLGYITDRQIESPYSSC